MTRGVRLDKNAVHRELWAEAVKNRKHWVTIHQRKFAAHLGIRNTWLCIVLAEFAEEGRIRRVANKHRNVGVYEIADPDEWDPPTGVSQPNDD